MNEDSLDFELNLFDIKPTKQRSYLTGKYICSTCNRTGFSSIQSLCNHRNRCPMNESTATSSNKKRKLIPEKQSSDKKLTDLYARIDRIKQTSDSNQVKEKKISTLLKTDEFVPFISELIEAIQEKIDSSKQEKLFELNEKNQALFNNVSEKNYNAFIDKCKHFKLMAGHDLMEQIEIKEQELFVLKFMIQYGNDNHNPFEKEKYLLNKLAEVQRSLSVAPQAEYREDLDDILIRRQVSVENLNALSQSSTITALEFDRRN